MTLRRQWRLSSRYLSYRQIKKCFDNLMQASLLGSQNTFLLFSLSKRNRYLIPVTLYPASSTILANASSEISAASVTTAVPVS